MVLIRVLERHSSSNNNPHWINYFSTETIFWTEFIKCGYVPQTEILKTGNYLFRQWEASTFSYVTKWKVSGEGQPEHEGSSYILWQRQRDRGSKRRLVSLTWGKSSQEASLSCQQKAAKSKYVITQADFMETKFCLMNCHHRRQNRGSKKTCNQITFLIMVY